MSVYIFHILIMTCIFAMLALSLNILAGFAGLVSLGHAAFFGIGAYASSLLMLEGLGFVPAFFLSGIFTSLLGLTLAMPALRVKDDYLAIVTLGFGIIMGQVFLNLEITGGADGLVGIPPVSFMGKPLYSKPGFLVLVLAVLCVMIASSWTLKNSRIGRAWGAIRDNDVTAAFMGINVYYYKTLAFVVSAFWAGLAGSLYAHYTAYINPHTFGLHTSIQVLSMAVLGGLGSITGSILGASLLSVLPEILRKLSDYQDIFYGALLVVLMVFRPQGIMGRVKITDIFTRKH